MQRSSRISDNTLRRMYEGEILRSGPDRKHVLRRLSSSFVQSPDYAFPSRERETNSTAFATHAVLRNRNTQIRHKYVDIDTCILLRPRFVTFRPCDEVLVNARKIPGLRTYFPKSRVMKNRISSLRERRIGNLTKSEMSRQNYFQNVYRPERQIKA